MGSLVAPWAPWGPMGPLGTRGFWGPGAYHRRRSVRTRISPPPNRGRRAGRFEQVPCSPSSMTFLDPEFLDLEPECSAYPSLILPRRGRDSARPTLLAHLWRTFGASWPKKLLSKRLSKTDQILMPFQHRFWSVLAPFWRAKMVPKSIKNR